MEEKVVKVGKIIFYVSAIAIFLYAIVFRTSVWINESGFFGDESALIINIQSKNFFQLFLPLERDQCCPPVVLCIFKFLYGIFGLNEMALRFFPYFCGIASLLLAFLTGRKIFKFASSSLLFLFFMMINLDLVYYSQEFKQYSSDVFFTLLIFYLFLCFKDKINTNKKALLFGLGLGLSGFISFTSEFVIIPICFYFLLKYFQTKDYKRLLYMALPYILLTLCLFLLLVYGTLTGRMIWLNVWNEGEVLSFDVIKNLLAFVSVKGWFPFMGIMLIFGGLYLAVKERLLLCFLVVPVLLNVMFGYAHLYPFVVSRAILWLIPFFMMISLKSFDWLKTKNFVLNSAVEVIIYFAVVFSVFSVSLPQKISDDVPYYFYRSNAKEFVEKLNNQNVKSSDVIFVDTLSGSFAVYDKEHQYHDRNTVYQDNGFFVYPGKIVQPNGEDIRSLYNFPRGTNIWFYNCKLYGNEIGLDEVEHWINENTRILYKETDLIGDFLYVKKIK